MLMTSWIRCTVAKVRKENLDKVDLIKIKKPLLPPKDMIKKVVLQVTE